MASSYPGALDSLTNPVSTDALTSPAHASQHANANDAIEAIEATLGVNPQGAYATVKDRLAVVDLAAGSAAASASAAAVSAASAAGAAVDAGAAANSAVTAYDNFDDRYLGAKSSAPTVDNDGNALLTGALYWNSTSSQMFTWTGSTWQTLSAASVPQSISVNSSAAALTVTQTGAGNALLVEDSANPDATPFVVDASGNVGIGTSSPLGILHASTSQSVVYVDSFNDTAGNGSNIIVRRARGTSSSPSAVQAGDTLSRLDGRGYGATGFAAGSRCSVVLMANQNWTDSAQGTSITFQTTANDSTTVTERVRINSAGNVGIGTSSPVGNVDVYNATTTTLYVRGDGSVDTLLRRASANASSPGFYFQKARGTLASPTIVSAGDAAGQLFFQAHDGTAFRSLAVINGVVDTTPGASDMPGRLEFYTAADGGITTTERMRIDNAGLITGTGTSLGAWTAYTPTLGGTGWAIGNGTAAGAYCQIGKVVHFRLRVTFGSTSTFGASANPTLSLPVTATSSAENNMISRAVVRDVSAGTSYLCASVFESTTVISLRSLGASGQLTSLNATSLFTWASTDLMDVSGTYEIA